MANLYSGSGGNCLTSGGKQEVNFWGKIESIYSTFSILNQKAEKWLTDSQMLNYEAILIDNDLELVMNDHLNPAKFLYGEPGEMHGCLEVNYQTKVRDDLINQLLQRGK